MVINLISKIFNKDKKVVICGLDNAGKSTFISYLKTGRFIQHTATMGKYETEIQIHGVSIQLIDLGGQKAFRSLWLGEMKKAQLTIFVLDASDPERFDEARKELWKLSSVFKNDTLLVLSNKNDLETAQQPATIIQALNLMKCKAFEVCPISCKTGDGILLAFQKMYFILTGKKLHQKIRPKAISVFDHGGVPLVTTFGDIADEGNVLQGGLLSAITDFAKQSFSSNLNQLKLENNYVFLQRTKNFMISLILDDLTSVDEVEAELALMNLAHELERIPLANAAINTARIEEVISSKEFL